MIATNRASRGETIFWMVLAWTSLTVLLLNLDDKPWLFGFAVFAYLCAWSAGRSSP